MMVSAFVGTSVDGFIARRDGDLGWLHAAGSEPHGYDEFIATVDTVVLGRRTFETVLTFKTWPYGQRRVVVLSSRPVDLSAARSRGAAVEQMNGHPGHIVAALASQGARHACVDGGNTIQRFLDAGALRRLVVTRVPVLIGDGIPLYGKVSRDIRLRHVATRSYASGMVQTEYEVDNGK